MRSMPCKARGLDSRLYTSCKQVTSAVSVVFPEAQYQVFLGMAFQKLLSFKLMTMWCVIDCGGVAIGTSIKCVEQEIGADEGLPG